MARRAGVDPASITFVSMGFSNVLAAFANKAVDSGAANEPLATAMARQGGAVTVATIDQVKPCFPAGYLVYGALLTKKNREAGKRFMIGYLRGVRNYLAAFGAGGTDRAAIEALLKKHDVAAGDGATPLDISPDGAASFSHVEDFLKWHLELGTIRTMPDIKSVLDDSFRQSALKAIQGK